MSILSVNFIDVFYSSAQALHGVSLNLNKGEFAFIVGRNGAGKTTLLKTICGVLNCKNGSIVFEDREIQNLRPEFLSQRGIRFIAQERRVFQSLTVKENLELAAFASGVALSETIRTAIEIYPQFEKLLNQKAGKLSGGQKEILLIVRALTGNPKLLLIDEPTEGLASIVIDDIYKLLEKMRGSVSAIIVEQNLNLVTQLADRIYPMKEGKIVKEITDRSEICNVKELEVYL